MTNKNKTFDCIVFGEIIYDIYNNITQLGGAPLNYSWYLSQFGVKALLISSVGQDLLGEKALEQLNSTKLISPAITMRDSKTGTAEIIGTTKDPDFIINKDVAWDKINLPLNIEKYKTQAIYFGTLSQRTKYNQNTLEELLGSKPNTYKMFDLNLRKNYYNKRIIEYSLNQATFVKMNQNEFKLIRKLFNISSPDELLHIYHLDTILITNGRKKVNLINRKTALTIVPPKSNAIDTIGAGDAFFATFTAGLLKNLELEYILSKSCEIASYVTEHKGAILHLPASLRIL